MTTTSEEPGTPEEPDDVVAGAGSPRELRDVPRTFEQVRFVDVVVELPSTNPVVVLEEVSPPCRLLQIPIGLPEGVAIAYAAQGVATPKPLTHELVVSILAVHGLTLEYLRITEVHQSAFSAELVVSGPSGSRTVACRPSDGIALALRQPLGAPIVVSPAVLDEVGIEQLPPDDESGTVVATDDESGTVVAIDDEAQDEVPGLGGS